MAIWQYEFKVVPNVLSNNIGIYKKKYLDKDGVFDDEYFWKDKKINIDLFNELNSFLPKNNSWSENILLFGEQESNRIEVYKNKEDLVFAFVFRIDFSTNYDEILSYLINFIKKNNFIIFDEENQLVPNDFISIKEKIENSEKKKIFEKLKNNS